MSLAISEHGPVYPMASRGLPDQDWNMIMLLATRFMRARDGMRPWAEKARQCVDFFEGRQWTEADLKKLEDEKRPALVINKILPLVNLVIGYHLNNPSADKFLPGNDGTGTAEIAAAITMVSQQIDEQNEAEYIDTEVFLDGILTGRGYYDHRLDFEKNALGTTKVGALDPFSCYPDPDASGYDLNTGNYFITTRRISYDEARFLYGPQVAEALYSMVGQQRGNMPVGVHDYSDEITPWRYFGGDESNRLLWSQFSDVALDRIDLQRHTLTLFDMQHYVRVPRWMFVDLETGDQRPVPDSWGPERIERLLMWAAQEGQQIIVQQKMVRRLRWTHQIGDVIVFDSWSPYETMTVTPYFPYFRRGQTRGMVEDLLDPQREINVRRSARQNIVGRSSNSGWRVHRGTMSPEDLEDLEKNGGRPGFVLKFGSTQPNGVSLPPPEPIQPQQSPVSIAQLESEAKTDIEEIAGVNKAALGQVDQSNVSGRAILARQQATVIGLEGFIKNWHRTKQLGARKKLELIQGFYTERRIIRVTGRGNTPKQMVINQRSAAGIVNDVTLGEYKAVISQTSLSDSFLEGQFRELMEMKQAGVPIPDDFLIDASSIGRKDELREEIALARQAMAQAGVPAGDAPGGETGGPGPGGSAVGVDGGSLPSNE